MEMLGVLDANNELFSVFVTWSCILLLKMMGLIFVTIFYRFKTNSVSNPEDTAVRKDFEVKIAEEVERVRRCHLNDLENILAFIFLGFFFVLSNPNLIFASWLIRIAAMARIAHSCIYLLQVRQPFRAICFYIMYVASLFMALSSIVYFFYV